MKTRERRLIFKALILEALLITAYLVSKHVFGAPSRRLCNLPYVLYQTALITSFSCLLLIIDRLLVVKNVNMLEQAIQYNQLQFFVWANLLTGLFNLAMTTYYNSQIVGYLSMFIYFLINTVVDNNCKYCRCFKNFF
jgi:hypothetical protein